MADFTVSDLDDLVSIATRLDPPIRPTWVDGEEQYWMFMHPKALWWLYVGSHYACAARRRSWWEKVVTWLKRWNEEAW